MIFLDPDKSVFTGNYTLEERFADVIRDFDRDREDHLSGLHFSLVCGAVLGIAYYFVRVRRANRSVSTERMNPDIDS